MATMETGSGNRLTAARAIVRPADLQHHVELVVNPRPVVGPSEEIKTHLQLYQAALGGDWETAQSIYTVFPELVNAEITWRRETALHIAAAAKHTHFVKHLVLLMSLEALTFKNAIGNTAFMNAVISGVEELAKVMMERRIDLATTRGRENRLPVHVAAQFGHKKMVSFLYDQTSKQLMDHDCIALLITLINNDIYDVAKRMLRADPRLAYARDEHRLTALHAFAKKSFSDYKLTQKKKLMHEQACDLFQSLWEQLILLDHAEISRHIEEPWPLIFTAAERGNLDFVTIFIRLYPDLIFKSEENMYSIFHIAILYRHEGIFKLIHEIGSIKNFLTTFKDTEWNNMLHLAAIVKSTSRLYVVPGAALQMQRELLWFEEVKKVVEPHHIEEENIHGKTPRALFREQHAKLMKEGEQWMRDTADSCMLVATLIATVVFAAAFTLPGGIRQDNSGIPVFLHDIAFKLFALSDAISLVTSASSVLTFLSLRTSRYAEQDFLWSLPNRLVIGLTTLSISVGGMMVAFISGFFLVFNHKLQFFPIPVAFIASLPVFFFIRQHYSLFADMIHSTYMSRTLFKPNKTPLFSKRVKPKIA